MMRAWLPDELVVDWVLLDVELVDVELPGPSGPGFEVLGFEVLGCVEDTVAPIRKLLCPELLD